MLDLELTDEMNKVLDELVDYIDSLVKTEKIANKKVKPQKTAKTEKEAPEKTEVQAPEKAPEKEAPEKEAPGKSAKPFDRVNVGDIVKFQVEGEEIKHDIRIIYKGKKNIIAIMVEDETEVFNIRKADFNKQMFSWRDRKSETYNIIVTLK